MTDSRADRRDGTEQRTSPVTFYRQVVAELRSGMTIGIGGWGSRRKPMSIVRAILRSDLNDLTVVSYGGPDIGLLCAAGKISRLAVGAPHEIYYEQYGNPQGKPAVFVHGGPVRQMMPGYHYMQFYHWAYGINQWLASQGYIVLSVNYRGSTGYGSAWRDALTGRPGLTELEDVGAVYDATVRWLDERGHGLAVGAARVPIVAGAKLGKKWCTSTTSRYCWNSSTVCIGS